MALAGLPIPAEEGSQVPVYDAVFADIGDEQSIEQSLSTFSGHMTNIIDIIERASERSLVLLDELGAGTDPTEGAALAVAIVERLRNAGATLIATTHHSELKLYAHHTPGVMNASVEFDLETLSPTYRLTLGLPGQSNALAIAARLGMPPDVIEVARAGLSTSERDLEAVLADLRSQLSAAEERAAATTAARDEAQALRADYESRLAALTAETADLRQEAHRRVRAELRETERLVQRTRRQVEAARLEQAHVELGRARRAAEALAPEPEQPIAAPLPPAGMPSAVAPGDAVWLRGIATPGEVLDPPRRVGRVRCAARRAAYARAVAPGRTRERARRHRLGTAHLAPAAAPARGAGRDRSARPAPR